MSQVSELMLTETMDLQKLDKETLIQLCEVLWALANKKIEIHSAPVLTTVAGGIPSIPYVPPSTFPFLNGSAIVVNKDEVQSSTGF